MFMGRISRTSDWPRQGLSLRLPGLALFPASSPSRHGPLGAWAPGIGHSARERGSRTPRDAGSPPAKKARPEEQARWWVGWNRIASMGCVPGLLGCHEILRGGFGHVGLVLDQKVRERHGGTGLRSVLAVPYGRAGNGQSRGG